MKTAISVSDDLLQAGDQAAKLLGVSRSRLFSMALQEFLRTRHKAQIAEQLNEVYGDNPDREDREMVEQLKTKLRPSLERW